MLHLHLDEGRERDRPHDRMLRLPQPGFRVERLEQLERFAAETFPDTQRFGDAFAAVIRAGPRESGSDSGSSGCSPAAMRR